MDKSGRSMKFLDKLLQDMSIMAAEIDNLMKGELCHEQG